MTPKAKCLAALQKLVRLKAADDNGYVSCVTCGKVDHYKCMDGGHYIAKGASSYWSLEEVNVHPQCKGCNGYGMKFGDAGALYALYMVDMYGRDFVDEMHAKKRHVRKYSKVDYADMLKELKAEIAYHEKRIV